MRQLQQVLTDTQAPLALFTSSAAIGSLVGVQLLTSSAGTYTPTSGAKTALIVLQAAGGGGGGTSNTAGEGNAGAGGAGETRIYALVVSSPTYAYDIGDKGAGGSAGNNNGGTAGDTTLGSTPLVIAKGGTGGTGSTGATTGTNGSTPTGSGGILLPPTSAATNLLASGGVKGGSTVFGCGGNLIGDVALAAAAALTTVFTGVNGSGYGSGGTGAYKNTGTVGSGAGGNGAPGMILLMEFK